MEEPSKKRSAEESQVIVKLDDIQHALHAADFYIGQSIHTVSPEVTRFVFDEKTQQMQHQTVHYPHGLLKIFDEALVNAADNRHRGTTTIKVGVSVLQNAIWVYNDGPNFPIVETEHESRWDPTKKAYQPEVAFFHCKTSSAYKKKQRVTGGKFGLGAKLIAIFSKWCTIEMCDGKSYYFQKCEQHMTLVHPPTVKAKEDKPYLALCFSPDLSLFYPKGQQPAHLPDTMLQLFHTRVLDIAGCCEGVKVFWTLNRTQFIAPKACTFARISIKNFKEYIKLFLPEDAKEDCKFAYHTQDRWQVCMIANPWPFPVNVSFVNSINTYMGGEHVKYIQSQVFKFCKKKIEGIDARRVHAKIMLFINATIEDPSFSSQCKETLQTLATNFGSECVLPDKFFHVLSRNGVMEELKSNMEEKQLAKIQKTIGAGKKKPVNDIPNFRDARFAGTRNAHKCTVYLVEGISAQALAEVGISVLGSDYYGSFPVKGKVINADNCVKKLAKNDEFNYICRVLGLQPGKPADRSQLRYGKVVVMTDADPDGSHIRGLIVYMFSKFWPELLNDEKNPGFVDFMITPIVVAKQKSNTEYFYTLQSFHEWFEKLTNKTSWQIKYYKGLATSTQKEGRYYFKNLKNHLRRFSSMSKEDQETLTMVFSKKKDASTQRRDWLKVYDESKFIPYDQLRQVSIQRFLNEDMVHYSWLSVCRAIPAIEDGFTPAARKCLWTFLKRNIVKEEKVCVLQSLVDKDTHYHHGTDSLGQTIIRMAQTFVGSQNINLFYPSGQFGTRVDGGDKTVGATRYIFSRLSKITRFLFHEDDDDILPLLQDEGHTIEPAYTAPILPLLLVNGANQVGTGYSCKIPCYRPEDLIARILHRLDPVPSVPSVPTPLVPWYHKFKGQIVATPKGFESSGVIEHVDNVYNVTELPIRVWREDYKATLNKMLDAGKIESFHEKHKNNDVCFEIKVANKDEKLDFCLKNKFTSNINVFVSDGSTRKVQTFSSVEDLFNQWFEFRLPVYEKRRLHVIKLLEAQIPLLQAKTKFIRLVIEQKILLGRKRALIADELQHIHGISAEYHAKLFQMDINSLTEERVLKIQKDHDDTMKKLDYYRTVTPNELWKTDILKLQTALQDFWKEREMDDVEEGE